MYIYNVTLVSLFPCNAYIRCNGFSPCKKEICRNTTIWYKFLQVVCKPDSRFLLSLFLSPICSHQSVFEKRRRWWEIQICSKLVMNSSKCWRKFARLQNQWGEMRLLWWYHRLTLWKMWVTLQTSLPSPTVERCINSWWRMSHSSQSRKSTEGVYVCDSR